MQDISIPVSFLHSVLRYAPARGISTERLLRRCGIAPRMLQDSGARVGARRYADLQTLAMREMGDEMLGYTPLPMKLGTGAAMAHWMLHSRTLGQALKRYCHFYSMIERGLRPQLLLEGTHVRLRFATWFGQPHPEPYAYEMIMFGLHRFGCWLTRQKLPIDTVGLDYPAPEHRSEYRAIFPGAPIQFSRPHCELVFKREQLQTPVRQDQADLEEFLKQPQRNLLQGYHDLQSWIGKTRSVLRQSLSDMPTLVEVSAELGLQSKQLRRLLGDEGIGYGELKEQLRRDVAMQHLADASISIEDVAYLTGFAEASTFIRAFRKWTGHTPFAYRKKFY
ncbi:AraC family transcriptional regulator [Microbulbifer litoralis]|uniref:AraC family transcriptional regulator n=1 Tax=Microbulbifer litoralis TaxID=2933965 RepID=UPI0020293954|nr:AraC family transcriptional regulator [Microbulbifer sp. GX H0434]